MQRKHGVISKKIGETYVALKPGDSHIYEFNETAGYLWSLLEKPLKEQTLVDKLRHYYDVDQDTAERDVRNFVKQYIKEGLIENKP
jgi:hypothetical protein